MTQQTKTRTMYRVWMLTFMYNPDRWVWTPVSALFTSRTKARNWSTHLNVETSGIKIEEEEEEEED